MKVVFVNSDRIGKGGEELGAKLMASFLYSLARAELRPDAVLFMNAGVRLTCAGSPALDDIALLAADGVTIASCGTCLDYYGLTDALAVGAVGNMNDTVATFMAADDVVSIG
ncbi:MAG: sulfurtransferase-like selenium metabolism protein YedF [Anaerosomatales bacterium]|nr:sulfurtransferase-like selenium metabolism protein YedF [Anaerosomatales bacterium]